MTANVLSAIDGSLKLFPMFYTEWNKDNKTLDTRQLKLIKKPPLCIVIEIDLYVASQNNIIFLRKLVGDQGVYSKCAWWISEV